MQIFSIYYEYIILLQGAKKIISHPLPLSIISMNKEAHRDFSLCIRLSLVEKHPFKYPIWMTPQQSFCCILCTFKDLEGQPCLPINFLPTVRLVSFSYFEFW